MCGFALAFLSQASVSDESKLSLAKESVNLPSFLCVGKKEGSGPLGKVTFLIVANEDADPNAYFKGAQFVERNEYPNESKCTDGSGTSYYAVPKENADIESKLDFAQLVNRIDKCFRKYSCCYADGR